MTPPTARPSASTAGRRAAATRSTRRCRINSAFSGENDLIVEFDGDGDTGASTYLDDGDEVVSVTGCIGNPDEPGCQVTGTTSGVTADGGEVTFRSVSYYFYICDCEDEAATRRQLGPPPSEPQATATPTPTPMPAPEAGSAGSADAAEEAATPGLEEPRTTPQARTTTGPTPTSTVVASAIEAATTVESTPTESTDSWDEAVYSSPIKAEGSGFGLPAALAGLLVAVFAVVGGGSRPRSGWQTGTRKR